MGEQLLSVLVDKATRGRVERRARTVRPDEYRWCPGKPDGHYDEIPELIDPTVRLRTSFLVAVNEFHADHVYPTPWFVKDVDPSALTDTTAFATYVTRVLSERDETAGRAAWFVPMTTLWWAADQADH